MCDGGEAFRRLDGLGRAHDIDGYADIFWMLFNSSEFVFIG